MKWAKSLRQVVSLNPDYTAAYQMLGTVLANTGGTENPAAFKHHNRAIK
jgi:hypothetical protein